MLALVKVVMPPDKYDLMPRYENHWIGVHVSAIEPAELYLAARAALVDHGYAYGLAARVRVKSVIWQPEPVKDRRIKYRV